MIAISLDIEIQLLGIITAVQDAVNTKLFDSIDLRKGNGEEVMEFDARTLPAGLYFCRVSYEWKRFLLEVLR